MDYQTELLGENLIFLISQPRSGSTLLQRILGGHPAIHTLPEPWLMLHSLYALRSEGYEAEYDASLAMRARLDFIQALPDGEEDYLHGIRQMFVYLYQKALTGLNKRYFLDKTPRYYFILPELMRTFPQAHYIVLLRNPIAVLNSLLNRWTLFLLNLYKHDLLRAPCLLLQGIELLDDRCIVIHYERLVANPESELQRLCEWLDVDFKPEIVEYGRLETRQGQFGDQEGVPQYTHPVTENREKWIQALHYPQRWRLADEYLQWLGPETISRMGYSYNELQQTVARHQPHCLRLWSTFSLSRLLDTPVHENSKWRYRLARLTRSIRRRGLRDTVVEGLQLLVARYRSTNISPSSPRKGP